MSYRNLLIEDQGAIRRVIVNRPDKLNSFTGAMHAQLLAALNAAADDTAVRAVIVTGPTATPWARPSVPTLFETLGVWDQIAATTQPELQRSPVPLRHAPRPRSSGSPRPARWPAPPSRRRWAGRAPR